MFSSAKETDPLLPNYPQAPEINSHQHHSSGIHNVPDRDSLDLEPSAEQWKDNNAGSHLQSGTTDEDEDTSRSVETAMGRFFRGMTGLIFVVCFLAAAASLLRSQAGEAPQPPSFTPNPRRSVEGRAKAVLDETPLIDGHNDLAMFLRTEYKMDISHSKFRKDFEKRGMGFHVDLPRLRAGQVGGAFWSAFVACPVNASYDMTDSNYATAVSHTFQQIDLLKRLHKQYENDFAPATNGPASSGRERVISSWRSRKTMFAPISIEGLHQISPTAPLATLRHYYDLGVRMATLTWNCHNAFADAALVMNDSASPTAVVNGVFRPDEGAVTKRGRAVLKEMNRLGMIIDISHTSYWTQRAVLGDGITRAPVVFSHSSAYTLCPHPRNVRDDVLELVKKTKSLVMVNFSPDFVSCIGKDEDQGCEPHFSLPEYYEKNSTLHQVARHVVYIGEKIGFEHVGVGSDFDGIRHTPQRVGGVDKYPDLVVELLRMGVTDKQAGLIVGGNLLRVWKEVDRVSEKMKSEGVEPGLDSAEGY